MTLATTPRAVLPTGQETYSAAMADAHNYIRWILDSFELHIKAPILEIGVGHGSYTEELARYGRFIGCDIDADSVEEARRRYPDLEFLVADITDPGFPERVAPIGLQTVVCLNVIEHIPDHAAAVANLSRSLVSGGHLLLIVPALQLLYNDLDRLAGHQRRYRREEVSALFEQAGLEVLRSEYFNPIGGLGWLANRAVRHASLNDSAVNSQITLFDRWLVPISRAVSPVTRSFFGQSVLAIGRKP